MKKKLLALVLCLLMALSLLPLGVLADAAPEYASVQTAGGKRSITWVDPHYKDSNPEFYEYIVRKAEAAEQARKALAAVNAQTAEPRAVVTTVDAAAKEVRNGLKQHGATVVTTIKMPYEAVDTVEEQDDLFLQIWHLAMQMTLDPMEGDYIVRSIYSLSGEWPDEPPVSGGYMTLEFSYYPKYWGELTAAQEKQMAAAADAVLKSLNFTERTSNYDKIHKIYRWIVENIEYDYEAISSNDDEHMAMQMYDQTAYSAIIDRKTICAGFSHLMYYMLWKSQVPARVIVGDGGTQGNMGGHAWNMVWFRGQWYSLDVTWDENIGSAYGMEEYFLRGRDTDFYKSNKAGTSYYHIPDAYDDFMGVDCEALVAASSPTDYGGRKAADDSSCATHTEAETTYDPEGGGHVYWCSVCAHTQFESFTASEPLTITGVKANKSTAAIGDTVTWTATATGGKSPLQYCFYVYNGSTLVQKGSYGTAKTFSYAPNAAGTWKVKVYVKDAAGATASKAGGEVTVSGASDPLSIRSLTPNKTTAKVGDTITWTATAAGGTAPLKYCFNVYCDGKTVQKGTYGTANTVSYKLTAAGAYTVKVFVKDASGTIVNLTGGNVTAAADSTPLAIKTLKADKSSASVGDTIKWTVTATGGTGTLKYCFYVYNGSAVVQKGTYGTANTVTYAVSSSGTYKVKAFVKDGAGTVVSLIGGEVDATEPLTITIIKGSQSGGTITWTANAYGGTGTLKYCFYVYSGSTVVQKGTYGASNTLTYTPGTTGTFKVKVFVKDGSGKVVSLIGGAVTVA